jgi:hypothetical protein
MFLLEQLLIDGLKDQLIESRLTVDLAMSTMLKMEKNPARTKKNMSQILNYDVKTSKIALTCQMKNLWRCGARSTT